MRRILSILLASCVFFSFNGCKSDKSKYEHLEPNVQMRSSFNSEVYVWESLYFPTNRTTGVQ